MVRHRTDVDGCGCSRCQNVDTAVLERSLFDALRWSGRLPVRHPSILLVFGLVAAAQAAVLFVATGPVFVGALVGVASAFLGRGYVGVVGRGALAREHRPAGAVESLRLVVSRFPQFCVAVAVVVSGIAAIAVLATALRSPLDAVVVAAGLPPVVADGVLLAAVAGVVLFALLKFCFLPEACFVGGYGPLEALRVSWTISTVRRETAIRIVGGFVVLLALGVAVDVHFADPTRSLTLSVRYRETTVVLRSFGFAPSAGLRFVVDLLATLLYSGVFVHEYVQAAVDP